jgi:hypothetical protein
MSCAIQKEGKMADYQEVRATGYEAGREPRVATLKASEIVWLLLILLEGVLALRVLFKLIAVDATNPFAALLYGLTHLFVAPFASLVGATEGGGLVLEFSTIIAMMAYLLLGWMLEQIEYRLFYRPDVPISVKQTILPEHAPQPAVLGVTSQTTVSELKNARSKLLPSRASMIKLGSSKYQMRKIKKGSYNEQGYFRRQVERNARPG